MEAASLGVGAAARSAATLAALVTVVGGASGCDLFTGPGTTLELVRVDTAEAPPIVPDTVTLGVPFEVTIPISIGCDELGPVRVEEYGGGVVLTPYTRAEIDPGTLCPGVLRSAAHVIDVTWTTDADFRLLIYAIDVWAGVPMLLPYPIAVRAQ